MQTILIISPCESQSLSALVAGFGKVVSLKTVSEAATYLLNNTPDVILADMDLGSALGSSLAGRCKKIGRLKNTAFLLMVEMYDAKKRADAAMCGADVVIVKPASASYIKEQIRQQLYRQHIPLLLSEAQLHTGAAQ